MLPIINIGTGVWGESSIMTGVYERWCSSTLHISWGLCDRLCPVLVCRGRYGLGVGVLLFILGSSLGGVGPDSRQEKVLHVDMRFFPHVDMRKSHVDIDIQKFHVNMRFFS